MRRMTCLVLAVAFSAGCTGLRTNLAEKFSPASGDTPAAANPPAAAAPKPVDELPNAQAAPLSFAMAEELLKQGKESEAIPYYEQARGQNPNFNDLCSRRLAVLYDRSDNQAKAMVEFQELLKTHPKDAALLNDVGYSYYNRGEWAEAETYLRRATAADKANKRAWVNLGMALAQQGRYPEAVEAFNKGTSPAEAQANLGFVLAVQGKKAEAKEAYKKALELEPTLKVANAALAKLDAPPAPKTE